MTGRTFDGLRQVLDVNVVGASSIAPASARGMTNGGASSTRRSTHYGPTDVLAAWCGRPEEAALVAFLLSSDAG
jgi:hypothetical protein